MKFLAILVAALALAPAALAADEWTSNSFVSPSGNIGCKASSAFITCATYNNGRSVTLGWRSSAYLNYRYTYGPRVYGPTLQYGQTWTWRYTFSCYSSESGMECHNMNGRGFKIAREGIWRF
jgi:hypothetical protein